jgi:5-methylcytosine-specific restriction endonuclease McrA
MQASQNLSQQPALRRILPLDFKKKRYSRVKILPDGREIRRGYQYEKRRREVLKRDGYECVRCGSVDRLEVHHICKRSMERDDRIGALETLCYPCHVGEHKADLFGR